MSVSDLDKEQMRRNAGKVANLLKSLSNPNRLMILCTLMEGEYSVGELNDMIPLSQSALSQHLAWLRNAGLVKTRREAQTIHYQLQSDEASRVIETLHDIYCNRGVNHTTNLMGGINHE